MLFIYPMWDSESERLGKKLCTPFGYFLHGFADLLGFIGLISLLGLILSFGLSFPFPVIPRPHGWFFALPFALGILGQIIFWYSWHLAKRRGFHYDEANRTASWKEDGATRSYKWKKT